MVKPPTLFLLLSYGLFLAAWDAQTATALSLNSLRADLRASVTEHKSDIEEPFVESTKNSEHAVTDKSRFGLRSAAHSIAQSFRAFFQGNPFIQQSSTSIADLRGMNAQQDWENCHSSNHHQLHNQCSVATLSATTPTNLPSFLLTASSALRFQHRLRTA